MSAPKTTLNPRVLIIFNILIAALLPLMLVRSPVLLDTVHTDDTLMWAHLGWRGLNGLTPVLDYPHFYGGLVAQVITWSFELFGFRFKAIDYAFVAMFLAATSVMLLLTYRRLSALSVSLLVAFSAALVVSLVPIGLGPIHALHAAHSYVYNHLAIVLIMGLTVFGMVETSNARLEILSALAAGFALYILVLLKTPFGAFAPFLLIALLVKQRWAAAIAVVLSGTATMLTLDFGMPRALGSLNVALSSAAAEEISGASNLLITALMPYKAQWLPCIGFATLIVVVYVKLGKQSLGTLLTGMWFLLGFTVVLVPMGGDPLYKLIPILLVLSLFFTDLFQKEKQKSAKWQRFIARLLPVTLCYAFVLPASVSAFVTHFRSFQYQNASLTPSTPARDYVVFGTGIAANANLKRSVDLLVSAIETFSDEEKETGNLTATVEYIMSADGIHLLQQIPNVQRYSIIPNGRSFEFTAPLMSRPVKDYPVWPTKNLAFFQEQTRLPPSIDIVMISIDLSVLGFVNEELTAMMGSDFQACARSQIWTLYARKTSNIECADKP